MHTWLKHLFFHHGCSVDNIWNLTHDNVKMKYKVRNTSKLCMEFIQDYKSKSKLLASWKTARNWTYKYFWLFFYELAFQLMQ